MEVIAIGVTVWFPEWLWMRTRFGMAHWGRGAGRYVAPAVGRWVVVVELSIPAGYEVGFILGTFFVVVEFLVSAVNPVEEGTAAKTAPGITGGRIPVGTSTSLRDREVGTEDVVVGVTIDKL